MPRKQQSKRKRSLRPVDVGVRHQGRVTQAEPLVLGIPARRIAGVWMCCGAHDCEGHELPDELSGWELEPCSSSERPVP